MCNLSTMTFVLVFNLILSYYFGFGILCLTSRSIQHTSYLSTGRTPRSNAVAGQWYREISVPPSRSSWLAGGNWRRADVKGERRVDKLPTITIRASWVRSPNSNNSIGHGLATTRATSCTTSRHVTMFCISCGPSTFLELLCMQSTTTCDILCPKQLNFLPSFSQLLKNVDFSVYLRWY